jgi:hypothetical protein
MDIYDGAPWSEMDSTISEPRSRPAARIEEAAFLCRAEAAFQVNARTRPIATRAFMPVMATPR